MKAVSPTSVTVALVSPNTQTADFEKLDVRWGRVGGFVVMAAWAGFENPVESLVRSGSSLAASFG
ncbi:hypothetical protein [Burkholderia cepacia]|uniref:hypothetical protein n=1 Tax=Burkholderia cepacia TaxID=292 RepID=UPI00075A30E1|nr:hypothetical protein [Burkholderia cepacia]KVW86791.1 hypothetical protein WL00_16185 [Burkholderia cepacia]KVX60883.1 hypothetical protein WL07_37545 [Burkholderia cepacia]